MTPTQGPGRGEEFRVAVRAWMLSAMEELKDSSVDDIEVRTDWDEKLFQAGLAGITWPQEFGGQGLSLLEEYIFHEESARAGAPEGNGRIGRILVGPLLIKHGSQYQQERYLAPMLRGEEIWCQGFSEPGAGSDLASVTTRAEWTDGSYRVTGQKIWTSFADQSDYCLLLARTSADAPRHRNLAMLLVDMNQSGVKVQPIKRTTGDGTFSEVYFDGALVEEQDRVGGEADGWKMATAVLSDERGPIEAITRYMNMTRGTARLRECCARGSRDSRLEELYARVEVIHWHAMRSLESSLADTDDVEVNSVSKLMWSHAWQDLSAYGLALGCSKHEQFWRHQYLESRAASIFSGSTQIQRNIIAERVLGLPR